VPFLGEIRMFAGDFAPEGWLLCDGAVLNISDHDALYNVVENTYGGDGNHTFALPDLRGRVPRHDHRFLGESGGYEHVALGVDQMAAHTHHICGYSVPGAVPDPANTMVATTGASGGSTGLYAADAPDVQLAANAVTPTGDGEPHENRQAYLSLNFIISVSGDYPSPERPASSGSDPFYGEVRVFGFGDPPPRGWMTCDGMELLIKQHTTLHSVLGNTYGGDGTTHFALPQLSFRLTLGAGQGPGLSNYALGEAGGADSVTLELKHLPSHTHTLSAIDANGDSQDFTNATLARYANAYQQNTADNLTTLHEQSVAEAGWKAAHHNTMPCLALTFCICVDGGVEPRRPA
jgi:microcystin-dependent protein